MSTTVELHRLATLKPAEDWTVQQVDQREKWIKKETRVALLIICPYTSDSTGQFLYNIWVWWGGVKQCFISKILAVTSTEMYHFALYTFQVWKQLFDMHYTGCISVSEILYHFDMPQKINQGWVQCSASHPLIMLAGRRRKTSQDKFLVPFPTNYTNCNVTCK